MYHSNLFKTILWALIALDLTFFLLLRSSSFISGYGTLFDAIVFLGWMAVCFTPMFLDLGIFEFKSKKKLNETQVA